MSLHPQPRAASPKAEEEEEAAAKRAKEAAAATAMDEPASEAMDAPADAKSSATPEHPISVVGQGSAEASSLPDLINVAIDAVKAHLSSPYSPSLLVQVVDHAAHSGAISEATAFHLTRAGAQVSTTLDSQQLPDACGYIAAEVVVSLRSIFCEQGIQWHGAPIAWATSQRVVMAGNSYLGRPEPSRATQLEVEEVIELVEWMAKFPEGTSRPWFGGCLSLDNFWRGVADFLREGSSPGSELWRAFIVNTQCSGQRGLHWFSVVLHSRTP